MKFLSVVSIQIFNVKNTNPSFYEIYVKNNYFPLPFKFEMWALGVFWIAYLSHQENINLPNLNVMVYNIDLIDLSNIHIKSNTTLITLHQMLLGIVKWFNFHIIKYYELLL
jgi:hypothetical protein